MILNHENDYNFKINKFLNSTIYKGGIKKYINENYPPVSQTLTLKELTNKNKCNKYKTINNCRINNKDKNSNKLKQSCNNLKNNSKISNIISDIKLKNKGNINSKINIKANITLPIDKEYLNNKNTVDNKNYINNRYNNFNMYNKHTFNITNKDDLLKHCLYYRNNKKKFYCQSVLNKPKEILINQNRNNLNKIKSNNTNTCIYNKSLVKYNKNNTQLNKYSLNKLKDVYFNRKNNFINSLSNVENSSTKLTNSIINKKSSNNMLNSISTSNCINDTKKHCINRLNYTSLDSINDLRNEFKKDVIEYQKFNYSSKVYKLSDNKKQYINLNMKFLNKVVKKFNINDGKYIKLYKFYLSKAKSNEYSSIKANMKCNLANNRRIIKRLESGNYL